MQKLLWVEKDERQRLEKLFGITHPNHPPANFREEDEEWVAKNSRSRVYGFRYTWYHQIFFDDNKFLMGMHFFGDDSSEGFAIYPDYWAGKVRYFSFAGCLHEMRELSQEKCKEQDIYHAGRCYHVSKCQKCGWISAYDSSD